MLLQMNEQNSPGRDAIARANKVMVDTCDWLVCYVRHSSRNSHNMLEHARQREINGLIRIINISEI